MIQVMNIKIENYPIVSSPDPKELIRYSCNPGDVIFLHPYVLHQLYPIMKI